MAESSPRSEKIRLGTRASPLAMAQAKEARKRLCDAHGWPLEAVELVPVEASGDKVTDRPLAEIGGKALWTKELDSWLAEDHIDAAVHSMKDVETIRPEAIIIGAVLPRADNADVLLGAPSLADIAPGTQFGTSAPRRAAQMCNLRPGVTIAPMRGNVATRLAKLEAGRVGVTMLAAAGLARLGMGKLGERLDPEVWLPAAAQGAIGIECRRDDSKIVDLLQPINHEPSAHAVQAERALLAGLGGTCHSPIGVMSTWQEDASGEAMLMMRAALWSEDGRERVEARAELSSDALIARDYSGAYALGTRLLAEASPVIRALFGG